MDKYEREKMSLNYEHVSDLKTCNYISTFFKVMGFNSSYHGTEIVGR